MQPITEPPASKRGLVDRMAIVLLIGVVAVSVGGVTLMTIYLDRIGDTAAMLFRGKLVWQGRASELLSSGNAMVDQFTHGRREGPIRMELRR